MICYSRVNPEVYHRPQKDLVFARLRTRDPAAQVGDLAREHQRGAELLRRVAHAIDRVFLDREILRQNVAYHCPRSHRRRAPSWDDRELVPPLRALKPQDWMEIASAAIGHMRPLFSDVIEEQLGISRAASGTHVEWELR